MVSVASGVGSPERAYEMKGHTLLLIELKSFCNFYGVIIFLKNLFLVSSIKFM